MVQHETLPQACVIELQPNRSASWSQTKLFLCLLCGSTMAVGLFWAFTGAWAVLPFSGLEAALVAFIMYRVCYHTYQRQKITVDDDHVLIQAGVHFPRHSWRLARSETFLAVIEPRHPLDPPGLSIFDTRQRVEIGAFLNREDKQAALQALKQAGLTIRSHDRMVHAADQ